MRVAECTEQGDTVTLSLSTEAFNAVAVRYAAARGVDIVRNGSLSGQGLPPV